MSHSSDSNITDCLPTIDQLNHAVRSIVRAVPNSLNEPKVQRKHLLGKKNAYKTKEPPKYADVVLPTSKSKQISDGLTDSQAHRALTIEGSFKPIKPKMDMESSSVSLSVDKLTSPAPQHNHTVSVKASASPKVMPLPALQSSLTLANSKESTSSFSPFICLASNSTQKSFSTMNSISETQNMGPSNFSPSMQEGHGNCNEVPLYSHSVESHSVETQKALQSQASCDLHPEHEHQAAHGQSLCISPPTVPPSVLEALNIKDGTHLFPTLHNNANIQILSIDNILGHNQLGSYSTSPIPNVVHTRLHDYSELVTMGYAASSFDTSRMAESKPQSQSEDTDSAHSGNGGSLHKEHSGADCSYSLRNNSTPSCMYQTTENMAPDVNEATKISQIRSKGTSTLNEDVVIELLLSKNDDGELQKVSVLTSSESSCHQLTALTEDGRESSLIDGSAEVDNHHPRTTGAYCVDCNKLYDMGQPCNVHVQNVGYIPDTVPPSRAMASLPRPLSVGSVDDRGTKGIFANEHIAKGTSFDPLQGVLNPLDPTEKTLKCQNPNIWQIFEDGKQTHELDCTDENHCNWLMFMQPAKIRNEQNIVAFQVGLRMHFMTTRDIEATEQLTYWYSQDYAKLKGCLANPDQIYVCSLCKRHFPNIKMLQRHTSRQHPDTSKRKYSCEVCEKSFSSATKLGVHQRSHGGERPFPCLQCHKSFTDRSNLKVHMKIHTGEKRHRCFVCGNSFRQKAHLESHSLTHSGKKPYRCTHCDKSYARQSDLNTHERTHTKAGCFKCQICHKSFAKMQNYQKHQVTHSGERNHMCPKCSRGFGTKYHLARHQITCKGEKQKKIELNPQTGAELGLSIAKKRIQKRDKAEQAAKILQINSSSSVT